MKLSVGILIASLTAASSFTVGPVSNQRTSAVNTALNASRNRDKIMTRSQWAAARGFSGAVTKAATIAGGLMKNDMGLEYVKLVHPSGSSSEVYLYGGVVTSYIDAQGVEYIAVRPDAKMDGSKPISGGLSHCWPQVSFDQILQSFCIHFFTFHTNKQSCHTVVWSWANSATWLCKKCKLDVTIYDRHYRHASNGTL